MKKSTRKAAAGLAKHRRREALHRRAAATALVPAQPAPPMTWQDRAIAAGMNAEQITAIARELERQDAHRARIEFDRAWAAAQQELPIVPKSKEVDYPSKKEGSGRVNYWYAPYDQIVAQVRPVLSKYGLGYGQNVTNHNGGVTVKTWLIGFGHREEPSVLTFKKDETGHKNDMQAEASAQTYAQRYTLLAVLGLATAEDTDAIGLSKGDPLTAAQIDEISKRLAELGKRDGDFQRRMFKNLSEEFRRTVQQVDEIPASKFDDVLYWISRRMEQLDATEKN